MLGIAFGCSLQLLLCASLFAQAAGWLGEVRPLLAVAGCAYLLWLSLQLARASAPGRRESARPMGFVAAALFQWVNPKAWIMVLNACVLFLPQDGQLSAAAAMALLALLVNLPCIAVWAWGGERLRHWLQQDWALRLFNAAMAGLLAATALWLLIEELLR
jgi:threonine/homoserine/homoserine lactone efflux protein